MRLTPLFLLALLFGLIGCAGVDTSQVSGLSLTLSNPTSPFNMNLTEMVSATSFVRTSDIPLLCSVTQTPGPSGVNSRVVNLYIDNPVVGAQYALVSGGTVYVEYSETVGTGTNVWRSEAGKLVLVRDDANGVTFKLTGVVMTPYSGSAVGNFNMDGDVLIRF